MTVQTLTDELLGKLENASTYTHRFMVEVQPASLVCVLSELRTLRAEIKRLQGFETAFSEWHDKTEWVQSESPLLSAKYLGCHRADVMRDIIESLRAENAELRKDAGRYEWLSTATPYRFKKIQDAALTDGGDCMYFHRDRFNAAIDTAMEQAK